MLTVKQYGRFALAAINPEANGGNEKYIHIIGNIYFQIN
jgi:hypothetical protein